jgi:hypothetical protein
MARNVNYIKPEMEMVEMEMEGSLLLTASGGDVRFGAGVSGANSVPGAGNSGRWSSNPSSTVGTNTLRGAGSAGKVTL